MRAGRGLPLRAQAFVVLVVAGGLAIVALRLRDVGSWRAEEILAFTGIALSTALAEQFQIPLLHRRETQNFALTDAVWTAGLLLAPTSVLVPAVATGVLGGETLKRWSPVKIAFNAGQFVLGVFAAQAVYVGVGDAARDQPAAWAAAALGMAAFFLVNTAAMGLVISLLERKPLAHVVRRPIRPDLLHWAGNVTLGILGAVVWEAEPAAVALLLVPVAMLWIAYRGWFRSMRQRDLMREMARTADAISAQGDLGTRVPESATSDDAGTLATTLNRMLDRLERSFERERRFISEASHELRTPITICRGHLETLGPNPRHEEVQETIDVLLAELERMGRIVQDLTTLARTEDLGFVRSRAVSIGPFLDDVAAAAAPLLQRRLRIRPVAADAVVQADPQRLTQALLNLLQNAVLHGRNGGPVELRAVCERAAWRFEVADEGGGLDPDEASTVFRPFARGQTRAPGSGLGLAIVRGIAEAHGGEAGVENRPGAGATFWIRLPQ